MSSFRPITLVAALCICSGCDSDGPEEARDESSTGGDPDAAGSSSTDGSASTPNPTTGSSGNPSTTSGSSTTSPATTDPSDTDATETGDPPDTGTTGEPGDCTDQVILDLALVGGVVSDAPLTNTADGDGWISTIDASAGGLPNAPTNPWEYLRFTENGLERVAVDDLDALGSTQWHIAAKRFGIRINSGHSGPSTVGAAVVIDGVYDEITELPSGALPLTDDFYNDACVLVDDGSGLGTPNYTMTPWWTYPGCVATTGVPFVIELDDGSWVKLVVDAYYDSGQEDCNTNGAMGSGSANFTWRWAFLP